ncbi:NAD(P)H-binding protein [Sneathiella sp. P13V-1]|uniref:NAD(P)H-binding protein n=1 Tax=Sneathiella sp. P13V-1 TaxID=2697366 RepID=UPI00187B9F4C|nr:NAD(P)H-binding protein [Sneathiella sp. P13V-1]MBE7635287.1 NAD(P)H-binding protein [Sneathiella sp. P13V-1]
MPNKVLITGATGMIGGLVLDLCLETSEIKEVISLVRRPSGISHPKLHEIVVKDFLDLASHLENLKNVDLVFYCLGAYTGSGTSEELRRITVDMPAHLAETLILVNAHPTFCLLSGAGADRTEKSRMAFARDKGAIENILSNSDLAAFYSLRPSYIYPVTPRTEPNFSYRLTRSLYPLIRLLGNKHSIPSTDLAAAMVKVGLHGHDTEILENKDILACLN